MGWIKISDTTLINSEKISAVEIKKIRGKKSITFVAEGKSYICENDPQETLKDLVNSGIDLHNQFFAG